MFSCCHPPCACRLRAASVWLNSQGWFLTDFPTALAIVTLYLVMVAVGPKIMSGLSPIDSYPVRFVYNVVQVRLNCSSEQADINSIAPLVFVKENKCCGQPVVLMQHIPPLSRLCCSCLVSWADHFVFVHVRGGFHAREPQWLPHSPLRPL